MNVVDSSGWLEYLADGPNASFCAPSIEDWRRLLVPTVSVYEVFKRVLRQRDENAALTAVALMHQGQLVELSSPLSEARERLMCHSGALDAPEHHRDRGQHAGIDRGD